MRMIRMKINLKKDKFYCTHVNVCACMYVCIMKPPRVEGADSDTKQNNQRMQCI